jgi:hypothetical protein
MTGRPPAMQPPAGSPGWPAADPDDTQGEHMAMTGEELFWELAEPMFADPGVRRSTMMGLPCVRFDGRLSDSPTRGRPAPQ